MKIHKKAILFVFYFEEPKYFFAPKSHFASKSRSQRAEAMNFVQAASELLMLWSEPHTLVGLCLELRRTLLDELVVLVLAQLRSMSLEEALLKTSRRVNITGFDNLCDPVFPTPDPTQTHYYLARGFEREIVVLARSGWRGMRSRRLCYQVKVDLADVRLELNGDEVDISVTRVQLSTNALMHRRLDKDVLRAIARLRLQGTFDGSWCSLCLHDEGMQYGFTVFLRYEAYVS